MTTFTLVNGVFFTSIPTVDTVVQLSIDATDGRIKVKDALGTITIGSAGFPQNLSIKNNSQHTIRRIDNKGGIWSIITESVAPL